MISYPSPDKIIEFNVLALSVLKAKKSDSAKVLSRAKLSEAVENCRKLDGDIYAKAAVLLKCLVQGHAFASGNRRTAFIAMKYFLAENNCRTAIPDNPENAKILLGIRENHYSDSEITEWIKNGKIRKFERQH
ncbi:MAG: type II toxin-antitoxin system death-on-curing family toxin [Candidatus Diapherotrites archaeon]|nr:type II toxin-antitoxin system death-on-curing family toxin [Candidatus Diapherotrites archaeon]